MYIQIACLKFSLQSSYTVLSFQVIIKNYSAQKVATARRVKRIILNAGEDLMETMDMDLRNMAKNISNAIKVVAGLRNVQAINALINSTANVNDGLKRHQSTIPYYNGAILSICS